LGWREGGLHHWISSTVTSPFETSILIEKPLDEEAIHSKFPAEGRSEAIKKDLSEPIDHYARFNNLRRSHSTIVMSPYFKWVFLTVAAVTIVCGIGQVAMALSLGSPTAMQSDAFQNLGFAWKVGFGAIVGLIGGKVT
jgi:hypothetical protein